MLWINLVKFAELADCSVYPTMAVGVTKVVRGGYFAVTATKLHPYVAKQQIGIVCCCCCCLRVCRLTRNQPPTLSQVGCYGCFECYSFRVRFVLPRRKCCFNAIPMSTPWCLWTVWSSKTYTTATIQRLSTPCNIESAPNSQLRFIYSNEERMMNGQKRQSLLLTGSRRLPCGWTCDAFQCSRDMWKWFEEQLLVDTNGLKPPTVKLISWSTGSLAINTCPNRVIDEITI